MLPLLALFVAALRPTHHLLQPSSLHASTQLQSHSHSEVSSILQTLFVRELNSPHELAKTPSSLLIENAHIITKGHLYETCMQDLLGQCSSPKETRAAERVDAFVRGFVVSERKSRARMKVDYILAGASSNRLDEAIQLLGER